MKAYHFLNADMRANSGDEAPWKVGETRTIADVSRIKLCVYGYHASPTLWDALQYTHGPIACLVKVSKAIAKDKDPAPKSVHASRTLIKAVNIDKELRLFAADCAERTLYIFERDHPNDKRPRLAIQAARDFAYGRIDRKQLAAAWAAARAAAGDAARDAAHAAWDAERVVAWDAARDAARDAERVVAWDAARDAWAAAHAAWAAQAAAWDAAWAARDAWAAAGDAARDVARDAGWDAARDAAWDAARDAAWAAERAWQRQRFDEICGGIFE